MGSMRKLRLIIGGLLGATVALAGGPAAADYPEKPVEMIVPTPPGGGTDIAMRFLAEQVEPLLGQRVVIVNRAGGGGTVGMSAITQARPDGYTIGGLWNSPLTMTPHSLDVPYTLDDYIPVTMVTAAPLVFCVNPDFPAEDAQGFVDHLRENPRRYTYGNDGVGGTVQLAGERIFRQIGVEVRPVPFGGAGETLKAFLGGHVHIYGGSIPPILPHVKDGKAKCLLLTSNDPSETLPTAGTPADVGAPAASTVLWRGVLAPKGTPEAIVAKLEQAFGEAARSDAFREFLANRGEQAVGNSSEEFRRMLREEHEAFGEIVKDLGIGQR
jgi:tripartite-type tricarboxylate transporter receptor subunit TctC